MLQMENHVLKTISKIRVPVFAIPLVFVAGVCAGGQAAQKLIINGSVASTDLRTISGRTYAPIADIARALGFGLVTKSGAIEMTEAGGAGPVQGRAAKIGELLFTGRWRFTPVSLEEADSYTEKYTGEGKTITPRNQGDTLLVLNIRLKNAQNDRVDIICGTGHAGNTALTDDKSHGYAPIAYDVRNETGAYGGPRLLPGAASEFAIIFSVPKGTTPQSVIVTITSNADVGLGGKGPQDIRIELKP